MGNRNMGLIPLGNVSEPLSSLLGSGSRSPLGWVSGVRTGKVTGEPAAWELQPEAVLYGPRPLLLPVPAPQRAPGEVHDMNWLSSPARWVFSVDHHTALMFASRMTSGGKLKTPPPPCASHQKQPSRPINPSESDCSASEQCGFEKNLRNQVVQLFPPGRGHIRTIRGVFPETPIHAPASHQIMSLGGAVEQRFSNLTPGGLVNMQIPIQ